MLFPFLLRLPPSPQSRWEIHSRPICAISALLVWRTLLRSFDTRVYFIIDLFIICVRYCLETGAEQHCHPCVRCVNLCDQTVRQVIFMEISVAFFFHEFFIFISISSEFRFECNGQLSLLLTSVSTQMRCHTRIARPSTERTTINAHSLLCGAIAKRRRGVNVRRWGIDCRVPCHRNRKEL